MTMRSRYDDGAGAADTALAGRGGLVQSGDDARRACIRSILEFEKPATHCSWMQFWRMLMGVNGRRGGRELVEGEEIKGYQRAMAEIVSKEFPQLAETGLNYVTWASDCEIFLEGKNLLREIAKGTLLAPSNPKFAPENAQTLHFLRRDMCPTLKDEYMAEQRASSLWDALKQQFERLKYTVKPRAEA
ncbi:Splicing factor 3B subunit 1 [Hordeum vulgare]|nr:Splicing factor 3B subunit 1 [Hordeum vulgare]